MPDDANERCPHCGNPRPIDLTVDGLCPHCLLRIALEGSDPDDAHSAIEPGGILREGQVLGNRYQIRSLLGRGGMGEVWLAFDLKLRMDIALKALRSELTMKKEPRELLRREVRSARAVVSPNVCRIFDLIVEDGQELVSMEYVDGTTLAEILRMRGPLELQEAGDIASQFLAGLEAIHDAGLMHRDLKPENIIVTRAGRVVVMDFGIAKALAEAKSGTVAGTPAYMAPEQIRGREVDARADIFSAGVVLAEMLALGGERDRTSLWQALRESPPKVPEGPWAPVLQQALAWAPEARYDSARSLARAVNDASVQLSGFEEKHPYPGLASFTEEGAEFFFGRELEVETLWAKLKEPHLRALIAPSGAGKSSFLRAGVLPTLPDGWAAVVCTPGDRPFQALAQTLVTVFDGEAEAMQLLLRFQEPEVAVAVVSRWRQRHQQALIVVDQFEELFTQNHSEVQRAFAELLGRLTIDADVHVLLSMRDDFLYHCQSYEALAPVFSELTPLGTLSESSLRRALVQPALACGYRFEDEALVDEIVSEVREERGALPLLAFAAARLWEKRVRGNGLLTREAYERIGRVGGSLAHHAESTVEHIGSSKIPIVRELFRNLVTAQGTRAARHVDELLSIFQDDEARETASEVLRALIDARLLSSYESAEGVEGTARRVEIVHESLLTRWPRLVRWRAQDDEGAVLRDQLRQAAQLWQERERSQDLLWTGTAFRELELWRERYPGNLTDTEEAFAEAAAERAQRQRRRRRLAGAMVLTLALGISAVTTSLWQRSATAEQQARDEALRAEASKVLALAQLRREEDPTEALAYTTASLELADTQEARVFAMRLLWEAPPALELEAGNQRVPAFSPDGSRLALAGHTEEVAVWTERGGPPVVLPGHQTSPRGPNIASWASNQLLVTTDGGGRFARRCFVWKFPEGERVRTIDFGGESWSRAGEDNVLARTRESVSGRELWRLRSWPLPDGDARELGRVDPSALELSTPRRSAFLPNSDGWLYVKGRDVYLRPLPSGSDRNDRLLGQHPSEVAALGPVRRGSLQAFSTDRDGEIRIWDVSRDEPKLAKVIPRQEGGAQWRLPDPSTRWAVGSPVNQTRQARVWDLDRWPQARPVSLRRTGSWGWANAAFHPRGDWLVVTTQGQRRLTFWPLRGPRPTVVDGSPLSIDQRLAFSPDGRWLATILTRDSLRLWPLPGNPSREVRTLVLPESGVWFGLSFDPGGRFLFLVGNRDRAYLVPLDGAPPRKLEGSFSADTLLEAAAVSPSGRRVATAFGYGRGSETLRVWDVETGVLRLFELPEGSSTNTGAERGIRDLAFTDESTLYSAGDGGVRRWNLDSGAHELVFAMMPGSAARMALVPDGPTALVQEFEIGGDYTPRSSVKILDLATGMARELPAFGESVYGGLDIHASGTVAVSADEEGVIRVGRLSGGEPHLLVGHKGTVASLVISPDLRWIASAGEDPTIRLWPMPDLSKPPLHTLPHDELIAKLKSLTNIRVVRDPDSEEKWRVDLDPFPGWKEVPTWW